MHGVSGDTLNFYTPLQAVNALITLHTVTQTLFQAFLYGLVLLSIQMFIKQ